MLSKSLLNMELPPGVNFLYIFFSVSRPVCVWAKHTKGLSTATKTDDVSYMRTALE